MIPNFDTIDQLLYDVEANPDIYTNGYTVHIDEGDRTVVYNDGEWMDYKADTANGNLNMSLYELNRQVINQLPAYNDEAWEGAKGVLNDYLVDNQHEYFMLYGRESNYFTVFHKNGAGIESEFTDLYAAVHECFQSIGEVKSFDITEDKFAIEAWAKPEGADSVTCFYLFPYDDGVVTFNE